MLGISNMHTLEFYTFRGEALCLRASQRVLPHPLPIGQLIVKMAAIASDLTTNNRATIGRLSFVIIK
jgi:hypothetical protein